MNTESIGATGLTDDQQMMTVNDRENYVVRLTQHFGGNRELASRFDDAAYNRSGGKLVLYRRTLQSLIQQRNQQLQNQQQQQSAMNSQGQQQIYMQPQQQQQQQPPQQTMINPQGQQQMYIQSQQTQMSGIPQQQQQQQPLPPQSSYAMSVQQPMTSIVQQTSMMNVKQELQATSSNMQSRPLPPQSFPMQQQQQQQQIKQELMAPIIQQQPGLQIQQMRSQQPPPPQYIQQQQQQQQTTTIPSQPTAVVASQQRTLAQHLQQVRQQSHLNQQQQDSANGSQLQQQPPLTNSSAVPPSSSGSQDEILQHILTSPNPPKPPPTTSQNAVQARLRNMNRNVRNQTASNSQTALQQQSSPLAAGSDPMMVTNVGTVPSPLVHPSIMQQQAQQPPVGASGQSPLARYMMAQSPQGSIYRPQMSPMNMMNYSGSPIAMVDDEMQFLFKFFNERIQYVTRIITRCQQEGQHDKVVKYRQLNDQMSSFIRNPIPEHLMAARRLKEHVDRILGPTITPSMNEMSTMIPPVANSTRLMTNGIFEQCQRTIVDYLNKDSTLKYNIAKRFLEPLNEVLNGVPHKNIRLDTDSKQVAVESNLPSMPTHSDTSLTSTIESELAHLTRNTFSYELKPIHEKVIIVPATPKKSDSVINDYELTCRLIEINMPVVPPLKMKLSIQYPNESPEILSLISTTMSTTPTKLENSDGNTFFETVSRNFIYFLFKLPTQHTVTDVLSIWRTAIQNASFSQNES